MESDKPHGKPKLNKHATSARSDAQAEERSGAGKMNASTKYRRDQIVDNTGYTTDAETVRGIRQVEKSPNIMRSKSSSHTTKTVVGTDKYPRKRRVICYPSSSSHYFGDGLSNDSDQSISHDSDDSKTLVELLAAAKHKGKDKLHKIPTTSRDRTPFYRARPDMQAEEHISERKMKKSTKYQREQDVDLTGYTRDATIIRGKREADESRCIIKGKSSTHNTRTVVDTEKYHGKRRVAELTQLPEGSSDEENKHSSVVFVRKKALWPEYKLEILPETSQALRLPLANTTITVIFRDTNEVYKMLWHGKNEKMYIGGEGWQSLSDNHDLKSGHRLRFKVLNSKKLEYEMASYIFPSKRKGKCIAPTINGEKENHEVGDDDDDGGDDGSGGGEPHHLEEKIKELRCRISKLESNDRNHRGKKGKAAYVRRTTQKLFKSQEQALNNELEREESSSRADNVMNEMQALVTNLRGMIERMLGELGFTNISGPGGVGLNQWYLRRDDNTDKENEDESTNDGLQGAFPNARNQHKRDDGPQDSRKKGKIDYYRKNRRGDGGSHK